ncbi:hypothetical protein J3R82DRAFT_1962 [Butyriboletus roseoflavus]|nr:hypothetical protein J3R82DRAFT_1962 [Butyriboletus roseoflavus]
MPPQPLLSEQAAFAKHLFIQGYPLWSPDPELLPQARQSIGLRIGDVGTVDERGRFDLFFNILDPLPPNFPPIEEDDSNFRSSSEDLVPLQVISSPETTWDVGQLEPEVTTRSAGKTDPIRVHCKLVEEKEQIIWEDSVWQPADRFKRKIGPPPDRRGQNNQTIFIRAITITPNLIEQEPSEQREFGLPGSLSSPPRSLNSQAGDSNRETATETPKNQRSHLQVSHPSEIINKYLLIKEPSAEIAVTHDSQWIAMLKLLEVGEESFPLMLIFKIVGIQGQSWTLEDLENHLEALVPVQYSIATHKGKNDISVLS